ncbi:Terminase-like family protein [compost metagenome]
MPKLSHEERELKLERLRLLEAKKKLEDNLPHLHGYKWYAPFKRFYQSFNKFSFLFAPNQMGKSVSNIRKCIDWATEPKHWPKISKRPRPTLFFYFYPDLKLSRREIYHKWIPELLPRNEMKDDPKYGWELIDKQDKLSILFNSGVEVVFFGYSQGKASLLALAASSPDAVFIDEEMPPELWPEVSMRVEGSKGKISWCATPDKCHPFYKDIQEGISVLPDSLVITTSMYELLHFEDGTPGPYTKEDIKAREATLGSKAEIDKRVHGKMVAPEGMIFPGFDKERNFKPGQAVPSTWSYYSGIDVGSGGSNHPAAIVIVAVSPMRDEARVVKTWRGDGRQTTSTDILEQYATMREGLVFMGEFYDFASAEFGLQALRAGIPVQRADKGKVGIDLINSLFKSGMLTIDENDDAEKLVKELESLRVGKLKTHAKDDLCDALRYAVSRVPWQMKHRFIKATPEEEKKKVRETRSNIYEQTSLLHGAEAEIEFWNDIIEDY